MSEPQSQATDRVFTSRARARTVRARYVFAGLAAVLLVAALALLTFVLLGHGRRDAALERIRAAGEPVLPEDIVWPEIEGTDPRAWIEEMESVSEAWERADLADPEDLQDLIEVAEAERSADEAALAVLRGLRAAYAELGDDQEGIRDLWDSLEDPYPGTGLSEVQILVLHAQALGVRPITGRCDDVCRLAPLDPRDFAAPDASFGTAFLRIPVHMLRVIQALGEAAVFEAARGRSAGAALHVERALCATSFLAALEWTLPVHLSMAQLASTFESLRRVLAFLPPGTDLSSVEQRLLSLPEPREHLKRGLVNERTFANQVFDLVAHAPGRTAGGGLRGLIYRPFLAGDHASTLESYERVFAALEKPYPDAFSALEDLELEISGGDDYRHLVSRRLLGVANASGLEAATTVAAHRSLALVAIAGLGLGEEGASAARERHMDPFTDRPLGMRVEPDGVLVLWSVGLNLADDGGDASRPGPRDPPRDLVWRVRVR